MPDINIPIAFAAGLVSFFAPCMVPLLPVYVAYVTGVSIQDLKQYGYKPFLKKLLLSSVFYILGFSVIFMLLGIAVGGLGVFLRHYDRIIQAVGGVIIIFLGLDFAGIFKIPFIAVQRQFKLPSWAEGLGYLRSFLIGVIFATAWTPCVGAILGAILTLAAVSGTVFKGALMLFVYSLGISVPFMIVSLTLVAAPRYLSFISRRINVISKIAGVLLIVLGVLLLTGTYKYLNYWLFEVAFKFGYQIK